MKFKSPKIRVGATTFAVAILSANCAFGAPLCGAKTPSQQPATVLVAATSCETPSLFSGGYAIPQPREVVRLLQRVPGGATLRQIKAILPRDTRYSWVPMNGMSTWKWNTLRFKGKFSGILVFANDRAKYRFNDAEKAQVAQWRATDKVHSIDVFLDAWRDQNAAQKTRVTKRYVEKIARAVGQRGTRTFDNPNGGPPATAWSAVWKLRGARELYFVQDLSYSESEERPMLQLSFAYSHLYVA